MPSDRERLILLNALPNIGSTQLRRLLDAFGTLQRVWTASDTELQQVAGITPLQAQRIVECRRNDPWLAQELSMAQREGVHLVTLEDDTYPKRLKEISDPPLALYIRGSVPIEEIAVAVIGSRYASLYGMQTAERLGHDLALRGVTIVSGLARGIDSAAHRGALKAGGRTVAVLGSGLAQIYPAEHQQLADEIAQEGAVISEYPMDTTPEPYRFPRRNRIISGLSLGVVVVEAAARSGALITVGCALEQGREVFAVPGPISTPTSQGTHQLLKDGARLVTSVEDILEELRLAPQPAPQTATSVSAPQRQSLAEEEERVFACVRQHEPRYIDAIAQDSGMEMSAVSSLLVQLELRQIIRQLPGKRFIRS